MMTTNTWAASYVATFFRLDRAHQAAFEDRLRYDAMHRTGVERYVAREALACIRERQALQAVAGV